jgi:hypothetical protein
MMADTPRHEKRKLSPGASLAVIVGLSVACWLAVALIVVAVLS